LLEKQIIPLFNQRDESGLPRGWVSRMKACISVLAPVFNTNRMVQEYAEHYYLPGLRRARSLRADNLAKSIELAHEKVGLRQGWGGVKFESVESDTRQPLGVHEKLNIAVTVNLGGLPPREVKIEVFIGAVDNDGRIAHGKAQPLAHDQDLGGGRHRFRGQVAVGTSGRYGFAVRLVPDGELFEGVTEPGLILWDRDPQAVTAPAQPVKEPAPAAAH
jgi:starch phosphorylase